MQQNNTNIRLSIEALIIAFLLGIVTNITSFILTRNYTTRIDREMFQAEQREARAATADAALGHLRSSYLAVKIKGSN